MDGSGGGSSGGSATDGAESDAQDAGATDAACPTGTVNFAMQLAPGASGTTYCLGAPGSCTGADWLSIYPAGGSADGGDDLSMVMGCVPDCASCQPVGCPLLCALPPALGDAGAQMSWNGAYYQHTTCGASLACTNNECAPAGNYVARMCGFPQPADAGSAVLECVGSGTPACVDVPFVWPPPSGTELVQGTIGGSSTDAGASD
jgi:hypothetical protein